MEIKRDKRRKQRKERNKHEGNTDYRKLMLDYIYLRDGGICYACRRWMPREEASREHVLPLRDYPELGKDPTNIKLAHIRGGCNK